MLSQLFVPTGGTADACDWFCGQAVTLSCHSMTVAKGHWPIHIAKDPRILSSLYWTDSIFARIRVGGTLRVEGNSAIPLQICDYG